MLKLLRGRIKKVGLPPETLIHTGESKTDPVKISAFVYTKSLSKEFKSLALEECEALAKNKDEIIWINVDGVHDVSIVSKICDSFGVHPLVQEDILNTDQRPKFEEFADYIYIVMKTFSYVENQIVPEQVSIIMGKNFLISFQEKEGDEFSLVRQRIRTGEGKLRSSGPDFLCYRLIDCTVDNYFSILEKMGEQIEELEEELLQSPTPNSLHQIRLMKQEMAYVRRSIWPMREILNGIQHSDSPFFKKPTKIYFRDVYDHTVQAMDTIEIYRETASEMVDTYLSSTSNRTNDIMRVLTIISTIFIPLTFIVGVYGMNFQFMPELAWPHGYYLIWVIMISITIGMLIYFKRKDWI